MLRHRICIVAQCLLFVFAAASAHAQAAPQSSWASPEEMRAEYLSLLDTLSQRVSSDDRSAWADDMRQKIRDLRAQVKGLSPEALEQISKGTDRKSFARMQDAIASGSDRVMSSTLAGQRVSAQLLPASPLSSIVPADYGAAVAGTTCSTSPTPASTIDGEKIGLYVDRGLSLVAEVACETLVVIIGEGTNLPLCIAWGVTKGIEVVLDSLIDHQEFCNSLLDGADAAATAANVINVHEDVAAVDTHLTNVDNHITEEFTALDNHLVVLFNQLSNQITEGTALLNAGLQQVMKLELTPEGRRVIVPAILTCSGTNCPKVLLNCPAAGCSWNNVGPLP
jgi:hypothetical protein